MKPLLTLLLTLLPLTLLAQGEVIDVPFNGIVTNLSGEGLSGVQVTLVKASYRRTFSDKRGRFGLTNVLPNDTLILKWRKEVLAIPIDGRKSMRVIWSSKEANEDPELVDWGYGFVKRREHTGFSSGISGEELRRSGASTLLGALQGRIAGLNITSTGSSIYRSTEKVELHGPRSFMGSSTPIFLVDGIKVDNFDGISLNDVEFVEVLKDASIYGAQGANGAILVRTRGSVK